MGGKCGGFVVAHCKQSTRGSPSWVWKSQDHGGGFYTAAK
ncbi:hypothetical protein Cadr_000014085 [Camelus dromedarius]|uniref:Uncharacterized protein n=1 Tax=Camelus dromedarius TaxID=9838 RepID=A0A5N4DC30_CAMDR|nr:hypothetical protein Cadr_000014085 [Camelus dromedarius]